MAILESIAGGILGTVAGMVEKPLAQYMDLKAKKLEYDHIEALQEKKHLHDKLMAEQKLTGEGIKADQAIMVASYEHDSSIGETYKWVNSIVKLVRPSALFLTAYMSYHNIEFFPAFMLVLTWWCASRVRSKYPE
jgi:hypothetical protein